MSRGQAMTADHSWPERAAFRRRTLNGLALFPVG